MPTVNNVLRLITQGAGTVNAITATITPAILPDSQCMVIVRSTGANNSTSVTFQLNGWSAYPVRARGDFALRLSDTGLSGYEMQLVFNTTGSFWELTNPAAGTILESTTLAAIDASTKANAAENNATAYADTKVTQTIADGVTETAPSENAVFDALATKQNSLGYTPENAANKDTDGTLAANSDVKYASQKATKTYVDTGLASKVFPIDFGNITNWAIADSVTYYLGLSTSVGTTTDQISFVPLYQGTIVAILTEVFSAGTIGSNTEDGVLDLFYNGGAANYTIATDFKMGANRHFARNFTGLNIPISTGIGYLRFIAPPYATNPSAIQLRVTLIIRP